jgi:hypothetical protein
MKKNIAATDYADISGNAVSSVSDKQIIHEHLPDISIPEQSNKTKKTHPHHACAGCKGICCGKKEASKNNADEAHPLE